MRAAKGNAQNLDADYFIASHPIIVCIKQWLHKKTRWITNFSNWKLSTQKEN